MKRWLTRWQNWRRAAQRAAAGFADVERAEQIFYLNYLREGMTVCDVGAHVGDLTLMFARFVGASGRVHAFEASTECYTRLQTICYAARHRNVTLNQLALGEKCGPTELYVYPADYLSWNTRARRPLENYGINVAPATVEQVECATLDSYCEKAGLTTIDLLKIDVEGAELQVLQGARELLAAQRVHCVTFEFGQTTFDMGNRPAEIEALFASVGYRIENIVAGDPLFPGRHSAAEARYAMHVAWPERVRR